MRHKEQCLCNCREHLQSRQLSYVFDEKMFEHVYRKFNGAQANAFSLGLRAADVMIQNFNPQKVQS